MKRILTALLLGLFACLQANGADVIGDSVLFWFVGPAEGQDELMINQIGGGTIGISDLTGCGVAAGLTVNAVRVMAYDANGVGTQLNVSFGGENPEWYSAITLPDGDSKYEVGAAYADMSGLSSGLSFAIELGNLDNDSVWHTLASSEILAESALRDGKYIGSAAMAEFGVVPWSGGSYSVPEPTSGLLLLIGGALLALRRRRA